MEVEDTSSSARVSIGFPLGLALLFALFFFICCFFCCFLHWDKILALLRSHGLVHTTDPHSHSQSPDSPSSHPQKPALFPAMKQNEVQSLPVLMPGDEVPKFIAMACPCNHLKDGKITIRVQKDDPSDLCSDT
ncbi:uncharacterized protein At5g65660-like isoform X2 [Prosopis cineraria]|uniref:uncharacterized protein At5g65660-like isoform X2 n=1 Tax=Prosopis cineraria TaxID=364024 RepID=UPI00240FBB9C|nr:uncharacterized protein At5g65660-like isoform X2 [Prosopis cineraria]